MSVYGRLSPTEQWQLHDYFQPSKDLTDSELLAHREQITRSRPALPQQAGRALAKLYAAAATASVQGERRQAQPKPPKYARQKVGQIQVYGVVKPEPDLKALARALLEIAKDMEKNKQPEPSYIEDEATGRRLILDGDSRVIRTEPSPGPTRDAAEPQESAA